MYSTVSARQIQRGYKKILAQANKTDEPIILMSNNVPQGAVIGLDLMEKIQIEAVLKEALEEYESGKALSIKTKKDLDKHFQEIDKMV